MKDSLAVATIQMVSAASLERNLADAGALIAQAADAGAEFVALPEYFCFMGKGIKDYTFATSPFYCMIISSMESTGEGPLEGYLGYNEISERVDQQGNHQENMSFFLSLHFGSSA